MVPSEIGKIAISAIVIFPILIAKRFGSKDAVLVTSAVWISTGVYLLLLMVAIWDQTGMMPAIDDLCGRPLGVHWRAFAAILVTMLSVPLPFFAFQAARETLQYPTLIYAKVLGVLDFVFYIRLAIGGFMLLLQLEK